MINHNKKVVIIHLMISRIISVKLIRIQLLNNTINQNSNRMIRYRTNSKHCKINRVNVNLRMGLNMNTMIEKQKIK